jgi:hypothetical protein
MIRPPASRMGPATDQERADIMAKSPVAGVYDTVKDRESAYEILSAKIAAAQASAPPAPPSAAEKEAAKVAAQQAKLEERQQAAEQKAKEKAQQQTMKAVTSVAVPIIRSVGIAIMGSLVRGMMGNAKRR